MYLDACLSMQLVYAALPKLHTAMCISDKQSKQQISKQASKADQHPTRSRVPVLSNSAEGRGMPGASRRETGAPANLDGRGTGASVVVPCVIANARTHSNNTQPQTTAKAHATTETANVSHWYKSMLLLSQLYQHLTSAC